MNYTSNIILHIPRLREAARRAHTIVELGVEFGTGSTKAFAEGFAENRNGLCWVSVDLLDRMTWKPSDRRWFFVQGDSRVFETGIKVNEIWARNGGRRPDLIFIDTHHTPEHMAEELKVWVQFVAHNALWIFHDTFMNDKYNPMTDVIKKFADMNGLGYYDYDTRNNGLGMMFKENYW